MIELFAPALCRCSRCHQLDDLSQMTGQGSALLCGPCWLAEARKRHGTERREGAAK